jgi:hypothetical protein
VPRTRSWLGPARDHEVSAARPRAEPVDAGGAGGDARRAREMAPVGECWRSASPAQPRRSARWTWLASCASSQARARPASGSRWTPRPPADLARSLSPAPAGCGVHCSASRLLAACVGRRSGSPRPAQGGRHALASPARACWRAGSRPPSRSRPEPSLLPALAKGAYRFAAAAAGVAVRPGRLTGVRRSPSHIMAQRADRRRLALR